MLQHAQTEANALGYTLKVYDCYRPKRAVEDLWTWSQNPELQSMKAEFYPNIDKKDLFKLGYIFKSSGHSRGSTVDLTMVKLPVKKQVKYTPNTPLIACFAPKGTRFHDNSIDMGTGFDCFDNRAYPMSKQISKTAHQNRMMLRSIMKRYGFMPYSKEWWHFTLDHEPYKQYFDFPVAD